MNLPSERQHLCTFTVGDYWFGVAVDSVQEVVRRHAITRVPLSSPMVSGLMNLRGQIVMVIDLRQCLGLPAARAPAASMNIVLRRHEGPISLLVDAIGDVREVDPELFELPPETLREPARASIQGVYKLSDRLLIVLDAERAIATAVSARNTGERTS